MRNPVSRRIGFFASLVALLATLGGHWYVLQAFAWAQMLARYSHSDSLVQALGKTLDGKHPCSLCLTVRSGRQQEHREQQKFPLLSRDPGFDLFCQQETVAVPIRPSDVVDPVPFEPGSAGTIVYCPPKPPPRS